MVARFLRDLPASGRGVVLLAVLRAAAFAGSALVIGTGIDRVIAGDAATMFWVVAAALAVVGALAAAAEAWTPWAAQGREEARLRSRVARVTLDEPIDSGSPAGEAVARAGEEVERFAHYRASFLGPLVAAFVVPIVVLIVIGFAVSAGLAVGLAVCVAAIPLVIGWFSGKFRSSSGRYRMMSGRLTAVFLETMRARHTLRTLDATAPRRVVLARQAEAMRREVMRLLRRNQIVILVTDAVFGIVALAVLGGLAVWGVTDGWLTAGTAIALLLLSELLREPVDQLGRSFYVGLAGRAAGDRIGAFLDARDERRSVPTSAPEPPLVLDGARVLRGGTAVITDAHLEIPDHGLTAVVGRSGAGKSSLALAIAGLVDAVGIRWGGAEASAEELRSGVAFVPQRAVLFDGTVRENLLLAAPGTSDAELVAALVRAGFPRGGEELPAGLDTRVGEGASGVSGGQAQRVSIARALLTRRPVLVADEPTAHLDPEASRRVVDTLRELARDRAVVMITHRPDEAGRADRIVTVEAGRVTNVTGEAA